MTDKDVGDDRDPLLVRPYVVGDSDSIADEASEQTWPAATTREVRSNNALTGEEATAVIPRIAPKRRRHRRILLLSCAALVVLLTVGGAAYATLRPAMHPPVSSALDDSPLPIVTGPATTTPPPAPASPSASHPPSRAAAVQTSEETRTSTSASAPASSASRPSSSPTAAVTHAFAPASPGGTGTIRGSTGLCLDLNGGVAVDDNHVQVFVCNGTGAQRWTLASDSTLRVLTMCAQIVGDQTVHIVTCDGRTTAQWRVSGGALINAANGQCLTDPSSGTVVGAGVKVANCTGAVNQRWSML